MAISHSKSVTIADFTGTVTVFNSLGATQTANATDLVRPSDWNSVHNQYFTLTGNTNNASTASGSNVVLSGGNGVTLIGSGSVIGMSVATNYQSQGAYLTTAMQSNAATISNINVSAGTTSQNLSAIVFSNSNGVSFGLNGSTVTGSHNGLTTAAASNHSHGDPTLALTNLSGTTASNSAGLTLSLSAAAPGAVTLTNYATGNTTQSSSGTIAGSSIIVRGSGGVSAGISNGSYIVEGPALTSLSATGALSASSNGSTISLGVGTVTVSATSNTVTDVNSSGTVNLNALIFKGVGNASVGLSNGSIVISASGGTGGGGGVGMGVSTMGNTAGTTGTVTTGNVALVGSGVVSLSQSSSGSNATISILAPATSSLVAGTNITISTAGSTITIIGASVGAAPISVSAGTTSVNAGAFTFADSNGISFGLGTGASSGSITASHNGLTTAAASNHSHGDPTLALTNLSGTTASASNGLTLSLSAAAQTAQSAIMALGASNTGNTAGNTGVSTGIDWVIAGTNNITVSQSTAGGGPNTLWLSGPTVGGAQTGISGVIVSDTTYTSGTISFSNLNGISFGSSAGQAITASYTRPVVSNAIQAVGSATGSGTNTSRFAADDHVHEGVFSAGVSTGGNTSGDTRVGAGRFVLVGGNNITLSQGTAAGGLNTITISAGAGGGGAAISAAGASASNGTVVFSNSNNVSFGMAGSTVTATITVPAQTNQTGGIYFTAQSTGQSSSSTYDLRTLSVVGDGIVSAGWSNGTVRISATQSNQAFSAGAASSTFQTLTFQDSNNVSFSNNAGAIRVTHNLAGTSSGSAGSNVGISMTHNSSGLNLSITGLNQAVSNSAGSFTFQTLNFSNANNVTWGTSAGGIVTASVAAPGAAAEQNAINLLGANTAGNTTATGSTIGLSGLNMTLSGTNASQVVLSVPATSSLSATGQVSISTNGSTISIGVPAAVTYSYFNPQDAYLQVTGQQGQSTLHIQPAKFPNVQFDRWVIPMVNTNSSNSSGSHTISFHVGLYTNNAGTLSRLVSTSSSTAVTHSGTAGSYSLYSGVRAFTIPHTTTITEGQYWIGVLSMTTSGGANGSYSQILASQMNSSFFGHFGSAVNKSMQYTRGLGILSVQTAALPSAVNFTDLSGASNSLVLRQPILYVVSGTN